MGSGVDKDVKAYSQHMREVKAKEAVVEAAEAFVALQLGEDYPGADQTMDPFDKLVMKVDALQAARKGEG